MVVRGFFKVDAHDDAQVGANSSIGTLEQPGVSRAAFTVVDGAGARPAPRGGRRGRENVYDLAAGVEDGVEAAS